ncbi:hypothetical protein SASPL_155830 [Salvia splendens]|uniref:Major facilitator superfamily (MFS) profile domain-containing protein n=1 Tax=Salvia splendens TaxID=180675 RepID=A0A8X8VXT5_SALSN|nr:hypothetical protein SASPL_155830 [Salvia splendens]
MAGDHLQVLDALDTAKTQLYHFTTILIAGMGFFTDAYDLFSISLITKLLGRIYYTTNLNAPKPGTLPPKVSSAVTGVALVGTLAGQLFFGWLGDKMGRKKVYGLTLILMIVCSIASGLSFGKSPKGVMATLCFFRFWLGFGIGGDYPLSATIMSEYANKKTRGAFIAAVFAMQARTGFGILTSGIVALIVSAAFDHAYNAPSYADNAAGSTVPEADYIWRIIVMFGALPAALTFYWRMKMPETARYTALVAKNAKQAAQDMAKVLNVDLEAEEEKVEKYADKSSNSFGLFSREFARRHGMHLLGTTSTWFLLDIAFYSNNLFQKDIFTAVGWIPKPETMNAVHEVFRVARAQTLVALFATVPGYWFTVAFIDIIGRFTIQIVGFFFMTVVYVCSGVSLRSLDEEGQQDRVRDNRGRRGAIIGAFGFLYAAQPKDPSKRDHGYPAGIGIKNTLIVLGCVNLLGLFFTFLVPEAKGKSLEEMSGENEGEQTAQGDGSNRTVPA